MFPTTCATTAPLSGPSSVGDRHTMPARSHLLVASLPRAVGLLGIMFVTLGVPQAIWAQTVDTLLLKLQTYPQIKTLLHFYGTFGLLPFISLFLSHLLTPTTSTLPPCRQHYSTPLITKILLTPLMGPSNPPLCHYFCYYLKWVYDNKMHTTGNTLNCS